MTNGLLLIFMLAAYVCYSIIAYQEARAAHAAGRARHPYAEAVFRLALGLATLAIYLWTVFFLPGGTAFLSTPAAPLASVTVAALVAISGGVVVYRLSGMVRRRE